MTDATKILLAQLRQHVGNDTPRRQSLFRHCCEKLGRQISRGTLHKIIHGKQEPGADLLIPIMRWLQLEGVIEPGAKAVGLFVYTRPLKKEKTAEKPAIKRLTTGPGPMPPRRRKPANAAATAAK